MKKSTIFRKAAKKLYYNHKNSSNKFKRWGCCSALDYSCLDGCSRRQAKRFFNTFFYPKHGCFIFWWGWPYDTPETEARVFALLLAAEMAELEGD